MEISEEQDGELRIVSLCGHLDTADADALEARLLAMLDGGARRIVIDCSSLGYINSAGLRTLLVVSKRLESLGGKLSLCGLSDSLTAVFDTVGLNQILSILATREECRTLLKDRS